MPMSKDVFWLENPASLLGDYSIVPHDGMDTVEMVNAITRLVVLAAVVLYLTGFRESVLFLLLALTIIIILYYLEKGKMSSKENFSYQKLQNTYQGQAVNPYPSYQFVHDKAVAAQKASNAIAQNSQLLANDEFAVNFDDTFYSRNKALAGGPNPKTLVQPIITNRAYDWVEWRNNDFNNFSSHINNRTRQFLGENGYLETTPQCGGNDTSVSLGPPPEYVPTPSKKSMTKQAYKQAMSRSIENFTPRVENFANYDVPTSAEQGSDYIQFNKGNNTDIRAGDVNTLCGYRPENSKYDMPVNYPSSIVQRSDAMKEFNRNIFTQNAGEDIFQYNQIIEPDNWNIGISFDQQFPPTTMTATKDGFLFQEHDPRTFSVPQGEVIDPFTQEPKPEDVYDPRQTGYGPNYRSYIDPMTGQPRFYYDDVIAVRKSNFITRNKIDHIPNANQGGVMKPDQDIFKTMADIRKTANDNFADSMITQRVELQQRLMRKRNSDWAQRKLAPIYGSGGGGRI